MTYKLLTTLMALFIGTAAGAAEPFVKGLDKFYTFTLEGDSAKGKSLSFSIGQKQFKVITLNYEGDMVTAVEDASGARQIVFIGGKPKGLESCHTAGISAGKAKAGNEYVVALHDFTGNGEPDLLIAVRDCEGSGEIGIYILSLSGQGIWNAIGEMAARGKGINEGRVFRQAVTYKSPENGVLYTWTYHDGKFDFLSSDRRNDLSDLL